MASNTGSNGRLVIVAAVAAFIGGCWMGMGSDDGSPAYCVVTAESAAGRPGFAPGQLVERQGSDCEPGEPQVCGTFESSGDPESFAADECKDD